MPPVVRASGIPLAAITLWGLGMGACGGGQALQVKMVSASVQPPANVALYLKVTRPDGQPTTLVATDFKVYEDGKVIPAKKLKRALLPASFAVDRYVLVVVDLSGPLVDSEYLSTLQDTVASLAVRLGKDSHLAVSAFDGDGLKPFVTFDDTDPKPGLAAMRKFRPRNRNIDLWGTFVEALAGLDEAASHATAPNHQTSLILMTDRRDKAGRHSRDEALARVQASPSDVYVIGIGEGVSKEELEPLGKSGAFFVEEPHDLDKPFVDASEKIDALRAEDYVFAYCSAARPSKRAAKHKVELKIVTPQWRGDVEHEFSSRGFVKGPCDPRKKPDFSAAAEEAEGADGGSDADADAKSDDKPQGKSSKKSGRGKKKAKPADEDEGDTDSDPGDGR